MHGWKEGGRHFRALPLTALLLGKLQVAWFSAGGHISLTASDSGPRPWSLHGHQFQESPFPFARLVSPRKTKLSTEAELGPGTGGCSGYVGLGDIRLCLCKGQERASQRLTIRPCVVASVVHPYPSAQDPKIKTQPSIRMSWGKGGGNWSQTLLLRRSQASGGKPFAGVTSAGVLPLRKAQAGPAQEQCKDHAWAGAGGS